MLYTIRSLCKKALYKYSRSTRFIIRDPVAPHHLASTRTQVGTLPRSVPAFLNAGSDGYLLFRLDSYSLDRKGDSTRYLSGE